MSVIKRSFSRGLTAILIGAIIGFVLLGIFTLWLQLLYAAIVLSYLIRG